MQSKDQLNRETANKLDSMQLTKKARYIVESTDYNLLYDIFGKMENPDQVEHYINEYYQEEIYYINYCNGIVKETCGFLEDVQQIADNNASYTQHNIIIENELGEPVAIRKWYGVKPEEEDDIIQFGDCGYYDHWVLM